VSCRGESRKRHENAAGPGKQTLHIPTSRCRSVSLEHVMLPPLKSACQPNDGEARTPRAFRLASCSKPPK
jgi:hypothetical protein